MKFAKMKNIMYIITFATQICEFKNGSKLPYSKLAQKNSDNNQKPNSNTFSILLLSAADILCLRLCKFFGN